MSALIDHGADLLGFQQLFFREYPVDCPSDIGTIVAPCRSKVASVSSIGADGKVPEKHLFGKQNYLTLEELFGDRENLVTDFSGGFFFNLYLSPWDYHFLIFPVDGTVRSSERIDGGSLPVVLSGSAITKNEKLIACLETDRGFTCAVVMVASWMVSGLEPRYQVNRTYRKGDPFGRFRIGSTVILLFPSDTVEPLCRPSQKLELGAPIARIVGGTK